MSLFLNHHLSDSPDNAIINIDNESNKEEDQRPGSLYFKATIHFQDNFTKLLGQQVKGLKSINVKVDFSRIAEEKEQSELC